MFVGWNLGRSLKIVHSAEVQRRRMRETLGGNSWDNCSTQLFHGMAQDRHSHNFLSNGLQYISNLAVLVSMRLCGSRLCSVNSPLLPRDKCPTFTCVSSELHSCCPASQSLTVPVCLQKSTSIAKYDQSLPSSVFIAMVQTAISGKQICVSI